MECHVSTFPNRLVVVDSEVDGQKRLGGDLTLLDLGFVLQAPSLSVIHAKFMEIAHVSTPAGFAAPPEEREGAKGGAKQSKPAFSDLGERPLRSIGIVFTNKFALRLAHKGREVLHNCHCEKCGPKNEERRLADNRRLAGLGLHRHIKGTERQEKEKKMKKASKLMNKKKVKLNGVSRVRGVVIAQER